MDELSPEEKQRIDDCTLLACLAEQFRLGRIFISDLGRITHAMAADVCERAVKALEP